MSFPALGTSPLRRFPSCFLAFLQALGSIHTWDFCSDATVQPVLAQRADKTVDFAARACASCSSATRQTPLHTAATEANAALAERLISLGVPLNARNKPGATPLFCACEGGNVDVVHVLLSAGAELWGWTASGENCMYIAALRGHGEVRPCDARNTHVLSCHLHARSCT